MQKDDAEKPRTLPFGAIRDRLDTLVVALTNLLDREFPQDLSSIAGLQPFLLVTMKAVTNIFETIRYVAADVPEDPSRKLEFGLALGPVVRSLADILFTLVFMREDLPARVSRYHRGGWRELKEDFERHRSEYGSLLEWQGWLSRYEAGLEQLRVNYGISEAEVAHLSTLPYWPTPGQMVRGGEAAEETKKFLQFLEDWVYRGLSADAHMSAAGIVRRHGFLLLIKDEGREEILLKLKSDSVFTAATLMVAICSEVNSVCHYGQEEKLSYLWRMLVEYWGEAKDLFERRYSGMLGARANVPDFQEGGVWDEIQRDVWGCTRCQGHPRVEMKIRQRTEAMASPTKLLVVSLAPPFERGVTEKVKADSVTNNPEDPLRRFLEEVLGLPWAELTNRGLAVLHAVKCAIVPDKHGFQNPPRDVVDACAPEHLAREFREARPAVVLTLGQMAYRALIRALGAIPGYQRPGELKLTEPPGDARTRAEGYPVRLNDRTFVLFAGEFPRAGGRGPAGEVLRLAARRAGVIGSA